MRPGPARHAFEPSKPEPVGEGASAQVYRLDATRVFKGFKPHLAPILVDRELALAGLAHEAGIPTPRPVGRHTLEGLDGILFDYQPGTNLDEHTLPRPWRYGRAPRQMAELHAAIHDAEVAQAGRVLPAPWRQRDFWRMLIGYADSLPGAHRETCLARLESLPDGESLCHGDMAPSNVMYHGGRCIAIDWSLASLGDPMGDVAFTWVGIHDLSQLVDLPRIVKAILRRSSRRYLSRYGECRPAFDRRRFERWLAPAAAARLGALEKAGDPGAVAAPLRRLIESYCADE
ncbi:MAG: hypothetical protein CMQ43_11175 [Gammaproteobacteria bacterium]|nr:hypothetical protein [Gammaproteobacteria bacterium]